jgi:hypothetical protein
VLPENLAGFFKNNGLVITGTVLSVATCCGTLGFVARREFLVDVINRRRAEVAAE